MICFLLILSQFDLLFYSIHFLHSTPTIWRLSFQTRAAWSVCVVTCKIIYRPFPDVISIFNKYVHIPNISYEVYLHQKNIYDRWLRKHLLSFNFRISIRNKSQTKVQIVNDELKYSNIKELLFRFCLNNCGCLQYYKCASIG